MTDPRAIRWRGAMLACLIAALAANAFFLVVRLADFSLPRPEISATIRRAFESGALSTTRYPASVMSGGDQYTDCVSMQVELLGNEGVWKNALAPRIASPESATPGQPVQSPDRCEELREIVGGHAALEHADTYTRFWHGQSTLLGFALLFLPVDGYRSLLLLLTLALLAGSAVAAALKGPRVLLALAPLFLVSFLLSGQTHYGQLVSYGPAQIACWAVVLLLISLSERLSYRQWLVLATVAGALEAFLDMMISIPLVAGIFLTVAGTLLAQRATALRSAIGSMFGLAGAWSFGFVASYAAKLAMTSAVLGWRAVLSPFFTQLSFRVGTADAQTRMPDDLSRPGMLWANIDLLARDLWHLGYTNAYSETASQLFWWLTVAGWIYALWRLDLGCRKREATSTLIAGAGYVGASAFVLAWVALFPEHTWRHSWIMVRMAAIWIAAGWGWALTDLARRRTSTDDAKSPR